MPKLSNVYLNENADKILYDLLSKREKKTNISHRSMPSFAQHKKFIASKPYKAWYFIMNVGEVIGSLYLSKNDEIGLFLFKRFQGKGLARPVLKELIKKHPKVKRFLANINPKNHRSILFFEKEGFRHIQNTYAWHRK